MGENAGLVKPQRLQAVRWVPTRGEAAEARRVKPGCGWQRVAARTASSVQGWGVRKPASFLEQRVWEDAQGPVPRERLRAAESWRSACLVRQVTERV